MLSCAVLSLPPWVWSSPGRLQEPVSAAAGRAVAPEHLRYWEVSVLI